MPLLNGKPLELHNYTKRLKDDEEVFYCEITNEIFETYDEYDERMIQCNCMVWSCAITGKTGLTYQEALQSEEQALKNIKDFAPELRTPVLYLATLTQRDHSAEMADDVFNFVRDRYFIGESVQASFEEGEWSYGQVTKVILPTPEEVMTYAEANKLKHPINYRPYPSMLYKYEVEELKEEDDDDDDDCQVIIKAVLAADKIRRVKGLYTKDKNRAYLKQFTEQPKINGSWVVKQAIIDKYSISSLVFNDIFAGEPPQFIPPSKKKLSVPKLTPKNGKLAQASMKNFIIVKGSPDKSGFSQKSGQKKTIITSGKTPKSSDKSKSAPKGLPRSTVLKIQKEYALTIDKVASDYDNKKEEERERKLEMLRKKKEEKRREKEKLANFAKEWQRKREDLECDDLKELPSPCAVDCLVPNHLFGEFIMIFEFFACFRQVLKVKDYFPYGLSFELLERALTEVEVAGPFSDILLLLLSTVFELQEEEEDDTRNRELSSHISLNEGGDMSVSDAIKAATQAARWSKTYHNVPLSELQLDAITVTDILRLHLLSSGARVGDVRAKWQFQERGGYTSTDDPGLQFRLNEPQILKFLAVNSVAALPIVDKLKVVNCLITQILTYATVRDVIDERYENVFTGKRDLKNDQISDSKKEREKLKKQKEKEKEKDENEKEKVEKPAEDPAEKIKNEKEAEKKKIEYQRRWSELQDAAMAFQLVPLGRDRGYRRFWIFQSIAGLFVEDDEELPGDCLPNPTIINKASISIEEDDTMTYIRKLFEAGRSSTGSDKENEGDVNQPVGSPKKKHFGEMNGVCLPSPAPSDHQSPVKTEDSVSLICAANPSTCAVHNRSLQRTKWSFFYREEELNELIKALNKRGYRENALRQTLIAEKDRVWKHVNKCPVQKLNRFVPLIHDLHVNKVISTRSVKGYEKANFGSPKGTPIEVVLEVYIREFIVDTEEKIYGGGLGALKIKDRSAWRAALENGSYESGDPDLTWPTKMVNKPNKEEDDGPSRPNTPCSVHSEADEPGCPDQSPVVRDLAMAVLQIARSIEPKYLQKPLPFEEKRPVKLTAMERWELSLMKSTNFSQVYLHLTSLENSIQWNKSVLNARCKVCRRGKDDANMLLCDGCDRGFHLYCLKPKLNSIPKGEWFCPNCRPKEKPKPQRSSRRRLLDIEEESGDDEPLAKRREDKRKRYDDSLDDLRSKRGRYP